MFALPLNVQLNCIHVQKAIAKKECNLTSIVITWGRRYQQKSVPLLFSLHPQFKTHQTE